MAAWFDRQTVMDADSITSADQLFQEYNGECTLDGRLLVTKTAFGRRIGQLRPTVEKRQRTVGGKLVWCYVGLRLIVNGARGAHDFH